MSRLKVNSCCVTQRTQLVSEPLILCRGPSFNTCSPPVFLFFKYLNRKHIGGVQQKVTLKKKKEKGPFFIMAAGSLIPSNPFSDKAIMAFKKKENDLKKQNIVE